MRKLVGSIVCLELVGRSDCPHDRFLGCNGVFLDSGGGMDSVARFASITAARAAGNAAHNRRTEGVISAWAYV